MIVELQTEGSATIDLEAGTYPFVCKFHETAGMVGTLEPVAAEPQAERRRGRWFRDAASTPEQPVVQVRERLSHVPLAATLLRRRPGGPGRGGWPVRPTSPAIALQARVVPRVRDEEGRPMSVLVEPSAKRRAGSRTWCCPRGIATIGIGRAHPLDQVGRTAASASVVRSPGCLPADGHDAVRSALLPEQDGVIEPTSEHRRRLAVVLGRAQHDDGVGVVDVARAVVVGGSPHDDRRGQHDEEGDEDERADHHEERMPADQVHRCRLAPPGGHL